MTLSAGFQYGNKDLLTKTKNYFWFDDFNQALKEGEARGYPFGVKTARIPFHILPVPWNKIREEELPICIAVVAQIGETEFGEQLAEVVIRCRIPGDVFQIVESIFLIVQ